MYLREIPRVLRGADPRRRALVFALAGGLVALNVHVLVNTISIYFALADARRGAGARARATGPRCARGLNC